jgi:hypothetical protein
MTIDYQKLEQYMRIAKRLPAGERDAMLQKLRWAFCEKQAVVHAHPVW